MELITAPLVILAALTSAAPAELGERAKIQAAIVFSSEQPEAVAPQGSMMCSPSQQPETLAASGSLKFYQNQQCGGASQSFTANEGVCQNVVSGAAISDWKFANTGSKSCGFYFSKRTSCLGPGGADDYFKPDPDDVDCYILDDVVASSFVLRCS